MTRQEFTCKQRLEIWTRAAGHCEACKAKLKVGSGQYDHIIPFEISRDSSVANAQLVCAPCHRGKTSKSDAPTIAKVKRIHAKHNGLFPPSPRPLQSRGFPKRVEVWQPLSSGDEHD